MGCITRFPDLGVSVRKLLVASIAAAAFFAAPAIAADMPVKAPVYKAAPAPLFNWTGFYAGIQGGYGWGTSRQFDPLGNGSLPYNMRGWVGGGTLGANWQNGSWLLGVEADISDSGIKGSTNTHPTWGCIVANGCFTDVNWFGTVRGRAGVVADKWLVYATGGYAYGNVHVGILTDPANDSTVSRSGWTAGGGIEYALAPNWTAKLEYLYVNLGRDFQWTTFTGDPGLARATFGVVRAGLNYKFGDWGKSPVVANY